MIPYDELEHHPASEKVVKVMLDRTQTDEPLFFRLMAGFYFAKAAASMRTMIAMPEGNQVPVNMYALNLAPSSFGKTRAATILEDEVLNQFVHRFLEETFPILAEDNLPKLANQRAIRKGTDPDEELARVENEFNRTGQFMFSFDGGSEAAVKQMRHKLLMANAGAMNLVIDEIGLHIGKNTDMLDAFMELYDGKARNKLYKNTQDNARHEEIRGITPTNMMLFGTANKLLDGAKQEEELIQMLESGYARRCFFGFVKSNDRRRKIPPAQALAMAKSASASPDLMELSDRFFALADIINANKTLIIPDATAMDMYQYKFDCENRASEYRDHEEVRKIETASRFFKALKLAGAYAFVDDSPEITPAHFRSAIKLTEESGEAFQRLLKRDKPYVKLARYIAELKEDVTHADLVEDLPFYPKAANQRNDMLSLATAWGYKNNIIIKKSFQDGIEFLRGESLEETDLGKIRVAWSTDITEGYTNEEAPFDQLHKLTQAPGLHWVAHHLNGGYRADDHVIPGFNAVVIDVDGGTPMSTAMLLLKDYQALYYTTKRHGQDGTDRFRIVLPTNYVLALDSDDYKEFMGNIFEWLPFDVDSQTGQRSRKWLSHAGHHEYTEGKVLDVLPFIPKTAKNEERKSEIQKHQNLDSLERWFIANTGDGNRNNQLMKFGYILVDAGHDFESIRQKVVALNDKLPDKLDEAEIMGSIMVTVGKALAQRAP